MNIFHVFLSIFLLFSMQINAVEETKKSFSQITVIKKCHAFFLVKKPNMMQKNMLVMFTSKSNKCPIAHSDRVIDCSIFADNMGVVSTQVGKLYFMNLANAGNDNCICNIHKNIKAIGAIDGEQRALIIITDNAAIIMPNGQERESLPKVFEHLDKDLNKYKIHPCSIRHLVSQNMILAYDNEPAGGIFVIRDLNNGNANVGYSPIKDLCYDVAGNQFEINAEGDFGAQWKKYNDVISMNELSSAKPIRFIEQEPLNFGMEVLASVDGDDLTIVLKLTQINETNSLLYPSAYFLDFDKTHQPKNIKRIIKFAGNFIIWDGDTLSIWGNDQSDKVQVMDGYRILEMLQ